MVVHLWPDIEHEIRVFSVTRVTILVCELKLIFTEPENYFLLCLTDENKLDPFLARCQWMDFLLLTYSNFIFFLIFNWKYKILEMCINRYLTYTPKILAVSHDDHCQGQLAYASGLIRVQIKCILRKSD